MGAEGGEGHVVGDQLKFCPGELGVSGGFSKYVFIVLKRERGGEWERNRKIEDIDVKMK